MNRTIHILNRVFAVEFYKLNTGFFLLVMGFCFGFLSGAEHKALAQFFTSSLVLLAIPISCWFLYTLKVILFNKATLYRKPNEFIFHLSAFHKFYQWLYILPLVVSQLAPAIGYAIFLMAIATYNHLLISVVLISLSLLVLIITSSFSILYNINHPNQEKRISSLKIFMDGKFSKPYSQIFITWLARRDFATLIGSKLFSCILIWAVMVLYGLDNYDVRLLAMGLAVAFSGNVMLVYHVHQFENVHFQIVRNLPIPRWKRLVDFIIIFTILCLPELGLVIKNFPQGLGFIDEVSSIFFSLSIGILYYGYLYLNNMILDRFMQHVFGIVLIFILMILFAVPIWLLALLNLTVGTTLFRKHYYSYQAPPTL